MTSEFRELTDRLAKGLNFPLAMIDEFKLATADSWVLSKGYF